MPVPVWYEHLRMGSSLLIVRNYSVGEGGSYFAPAILLAVR